MSKKYLVPFEHLLLVSQPSDISSPDIDYSGKQHISSSDSDSDDNDVSWAPPPGATRSTAPPAPANPQVTLPSRSSTRSDRLGEWVE